MNFNGQNFWKRELKRRFNLLPVCLAVKVCFLQIYFQASHDTYSRQLLALKFIYTNGN